MRFRHGELHLAILALLDGGPMHGYELMRELSRRMGRRYSPSPGSVYPAVSSLQREGLIASDMDGQRRVYELTGQGRAALASRRDRLAAIESRLAARFSSGPEAALGRFVERVRPAIVRMEEGAIEAVLDEAAARIESLAERSD